MKILPVRFPQRVRNGLLQAHRRPLLAGTFPVGLAHPCADATGRPLELIEAAKANGISRYLMVSAIGAGRPERWSEQMRPYYEAKADADRELAGAGDQPSQHVGGQQQTRARDGSGDHCGHPPRPDDGPRDLLPGKEGRRDAGGRAGAPRRRGCGSPPPFRSRGGSRRSRRCRSRRRAAGSRTWAGARCSRCRATGGSRASRSARGCRRCRRCSRRRTRGCGPRRRPPSCTRVDRWRARSLLGSTGPAAGGRARAPRTGRGARSCAGRSTRTARRSAGRGPRTGRHARGRAATCPARWSRRAARAGRG